jgi:peptidoglycan/LPS O-acetylase OafA/YrhL
MAFFAVPYLFDLTRSNLWDRWLGELSYPMYMVHVLISWPLHGLHAVHGEKMSDRANGLILLIITIIVSIGLRELVENPVDRWRQARVKRAGQH